MHTKCDELTAQPQVISGDEPDLLQRIRRDVAAIVEMLDARFLHLLREGAAGVIPPEQLANELAGLERDVKRCFQRLTEVRERRDLSFKTAQELLEIDRHCIWLFRKLRVQQAFLKKLALEAKLRTLVSEEAFNIYLMLLNLDEEERQSLASDDEKTRMLMLEEQG
jgi:hypothetical protein